MADSIIDQADDSKALTLSQAQRIELDRRIAELEAFPESVLTWAEVKSHALRVLSH